MREDFSDLRREYLQSPLDEVDMKANPIEQFDDWMQQATELGIDLPNAMVLATASKAGVPTARYVLLKGFCDKGFVFYSHSVSDKGQQLAENPQAALVFYWSPMDRQVRIEGPVEVVSRQQVETYFESRPRDSKISVWVAAQSSVVESREFMQGRVRQLEQEFEGEKVPCPENWVGYRVQPKTMEFWQGRENRLHDRILYKSDEDRIWSIQRLAP